MQRHDALLSIENLSIGTSDSKEELVRSVSLSLFPAETVALVGESGSGKTLTASSILGLFASPNIAVTHGKIFLHGDNLLEKSAKEMRSIRGSVIAYIPQNPLNALNPTLKVGTQLIEGLHIAKEDATQQAIDMLYHVGINNPHTRFHNYPHELSGGMRQRVLIAMSLIKRPTLLIADEPTTALDVTIQAEILSLLQELQKKFAMALLFITHDFGIVAEIADRVAVMYKGSIVEEGDVRSIFKRPLHPYTESLLQAIPHIQTLNVPPRLQHQRHSEFKSCTGCSFAARCSHAMKVCLTAPPCPYNTQNQSTHCWKYARTC